jgi:lysozyme
MDIHPQVIDLSHWDPASNYDEVYNEGFVGCIYKATQGSSYTDPTYVAQQQAAKAAGLSWGAYHFADGSDVTAQVDNFMAFASPDPDELFCLDWEDNGSDTMSLANVHQWISAVETELGRPGECVLYSGNTAKDALGDNLDTFLGERRLWLASYNTSPTWQKSWAKPWLWQFTDGQSGPTPHTVPGVGPCDISSYDGRPEELIDTWASGGVTPPPPPVVEAVQIMIVAPPGVPVKVRQMQYGLDRRRKRTREVK